MAATSTRYPIHHFRGRERAGMIIARRHRGFARCLPPLAPVWLPGVLMPAAAQVRAGAFAVRTGDRIAGAHVGTGPHTNDMPTTGCWPVHTGGLPLSIRTLS